MVIVHWQLPLACLSDMVNNQNQGEGDASTKQGYFQAAFWLVLFHLIFALLNVIGDFLSPAKSVAVSRSSAPLYSKVRQPSVRSL